LPITLSSLHSLGDYIYSLSSAPLGLHSLPPDISNINIPILLQQQGSPSAFRLASQSLTTTQFLVFLTEAILSHNGSSHDQSTPFSRSTTQQASSSCAKAVRRPGETELHFSQKIRRTTQRATTQSWPHQPS